MTDMRMELQLSASACGWQRSVCLPAHRADVGGVYSCRSTDISNMFCTHHDVLPCYDILGHIPETQHPFAVVSGQGPTFLLLKGGFGLDRNVCCVPKTPMLHLLIALRYSFKVLPAVSVVMVGEAMEAKITWQYWTD